MREISLIRDGATASARVRVFELFVDEPEEQDGHNMGPRPTEYLLIALVGCYSHTFFAIAEKRKLDVKKIECRAKRYINRRENIMKNAELELRITGGTSDEEIGVVKNLLPMCVQ